MHALQDSLSALCLPWKLHGVGVQSQKTRFKLIALSSFSVSKLVHYEPGCFQAGVVVCTAPPRQLALDFLHRLHH